jgi:hypothetical protein
VRRASLALIAAALLAGCGSDDNNGSNAGTGTGDTFTTAPTTWDGPPEPSEDGTISVAGFNEYARTLPDEQRGPRELALEFLQVEAPPYSVDVETRPGGSTVTLLRDNLEDDSVRAQRYTLEFALFSGGEVNLGSARVDYKCQPNRGHQNFSPELCL